MLLLLLCNNSIINDMYICFVFSEVVLPNFQSILSAINSLPLYPHTPHHADDDASPPSSPPRPAPSLISKKTHKKPRLSSLDSSTSPDGEWIDGGMGLKGGVNSRYISGGEGAREKSVDMCQSVLLQTLGKRKLFYDRITV